MSLVYDTKLHLMVRLHLWRSAECRVPLHCHYSQLLFEIKKVESVWVLCVIYWPSTEPSIKRCTCVNKRKNSRSRWTLNNNITRAQTTWVSWRLDASVRISLQTEGLWPSVTHSWATKPRWERNAAMVKRRTWGQYSSLSPSPAHLSHKTTITLSRIKCERLYFYEEVCSFVHWRSSLLLIMFRIYLYMYVAIQDYVRVKWICLQIIHIRWKRVQERIPLRNNYKKSKQMYIESDCLISKHKITLDGLACH